MAKTKKAATRRTATKLRKTVRKAAAKATQKAAAKTKKPAAPGSPPRAAHTLAPYLAIRDAASAIEWYKKVFGAKETYRMPSPDGKIMHAHLRIGDSDLFLADLFPGSDLKDPTLAGPTVTLHLEHRNIDKYWANALAHGATVTMPLDDQFWGDRYGKLLDPYGHSWSLAWKSKLSKAELEQKREQAMKEFAAHSEAGAADDPAVNGA